MTNAVFGGQGLPLDIRSVSRRWRKLSEQRRFASEADLFEIFPVAGTMSSLPPPHLSLAVDCV
jgi:hypothetical protein